MTLTLKIDIFLLRCLWIFDEMRFPDFFFLYTGPSHIMFAAHTFQGNVELWIMLQVIELCGNQF